MQPNSNPDTAPAAQPARAAAMVRDALPVGGLFAGHQWRISPTPFPVGPDLVKDLELLGRVLWRFYGAVNLLYRRSVEGKQPAWVAELLDRGKPAELVAWQRHAGFKNELPRVIRPDILLTEEGFAITELDSVPGGIGLTAWLNQTYATLPAVTSPAGPGSATVDHPSRHHPVTGPGATVIGGARGMLDGFASIFGEAAQVQIIVAEESATYRPEMVWLTEQLGQARFTVRTANFNGVQPGDAVYRFFELFDLANVPASRALFELAAAGKIRLTPPPKPMFEEKSLFALLWNRNLHGFWRQELGEGFLNRLQGWVPRTWVVDPAPLPPHAAIPGLELTDWQQLKLLSQRQRDLILKISGFHETAWGARGVSLGSDLSAADWSGAVDLALRSFAQSPFVLQRYHKPRQVESGWFDFRTDALVPMAGRVRLCPYYFVPGEGNLGHPRLGGVLATVCPADKKIIHGMAEAILAPCCA